MKKEMIWTEKQREAIEIRDENILVAAAAGSGKTAVLVERIRRLIVEDRVPVDRMLIVTFTNAAAAEMKEKIRQALYKEQENGGEDGVYARRQLSLLPQASISTFHSFALNVIRKYFYLTDLEPGFTICDEAGAAIMGEDAMDELMEKKFEEGSPEFYDFLDRYSSGRNVNGVREMILSTHKTVMAMPYPYKWMEEKIGELFLPEEEFSKTKLMASVWEYVNESLKKAVETTLRTEEFLKDEGFDRFAVKVREGLGAALEEAVREASAKDFDRLGQVLSTVSGPRLVPNKEEKAVWPDIKEKVSVSIKDAVTRVKELRENIFCGSLEEQVRDMNETAPFVRYLAGLVKEFDQIYLQDKKKRKTADFADIEHYCLKVLENPEAQEFYREKFKYIFIDEYQDTNVIQEEIIGRIKRKDNLFMVGDIKQSIYRFRLAEPSIFRRKYAEYGECLDGTSRKIDLNRNYRSKSAVLEGINRVFEGVMDDYDQDARLYPGIEYGGELNFRPEMLVLDFAEGEKENAGAEALPEELAELKKVEMEALQAANLISDSLGREYFDPKTGEIRTLERRDIVILLRSARNYADVYYSILKRCGLDAYVDDNEGYFDTMEIQVFMNLLSVIDNKKQDVPLISVLHSEIFGFSADDLAKVRIGQKTGSFESALRSYGETHGGDALGEKCAFALSAIDEWKGQSRIMPLGRFIWKLMLDTGYYIIMGAMPGGSQRQANLRALVDKAEEFSSDNQGSLYGFMRYIDSVKTRKVRIGQVRLIGEKDDVVRIMTIHKSKGLEFPMVILAGCGRRLNYSKGGRGVALHRELGIGLTLENPAERWYRQTLVQRAVKLAVRREEAEEEVRVLYVAMTRAKDILYVLGSVNKGKEYAAARESGLSKDTNYLSMISDSMPYRLIKASDVDGSLMSEKSHVRGDILNRDIFRGRLTKEQRDRVISILEYEYPFSEARLLKPKYSVSELNAASYGEDGEMEKMRLGPEQEEAERPVWKGEAELRIPNFMVRERKLSPAERGTCFHRLMENLDFAKAREAGAGYVAHVVEEMRRRGVFSDEEADSIGTKSVADFFETDIGRRAAAAAERGDLRREKPFTLVSDRKGEPIMIQGMIDCFFSEGDKAVLVDYKTNRIDPSRDIEEEAERIKDAYREQIAIYRDAVLKGTGASQCEAFLYLVQAGEVIAMDK